MPNYYSLKHTTKDEDHTIALFMEDSKIDDVVRIQVYKIMQRLDDIFEVEYNTTLDLNKAIGELVAERDKMKDEITELEEQLADCIRS